MLRKSFLKILFVVLIENFWEKGKFSSKFFKFRNKNTENTAKITFTEERAQLLATENHR